MMSGVVTTVNVLMNLLIGVIIALYILNSKDTSVAQAKKMTYSLFAVEKANASWRVWRIFTACSAASSPVS